MSHPAAVNSQVAMNFRAFQAKLPELVQTHAGKSAVMHNGEIVDYFDSYADAVKIGLDRFGDYGNFLVQEVTDHTISLGFHSYVSDVQ